MTIDDLISRLDGVRRSANGWLARCPGHDDTNPSLSIREGDKGIVLKCWAGCITEDVCAALGITMRDLFCDSAQPFDREAIHRRRTKRAGQQRREKIALLVDARRIDEYRFAERTIQALTGVDISGWTAKQLDEAMNKACDAHISLLAEERSTFEEQSSVVGF